VADADSRAKTLIDRIRKRYARQLASEGRRPSDADAVFDEKVLTLGFARRFATYKRPNLLLHDPERLVRCFPILSVRRSWSSPERLIPRTYPDKR
jgi:glucan phosphorylase